MITIDQLLESVDLDFEPRFVTKDDESDIAIWAEKPTFMEGEYIDYWSGGRNATLEKLKLSEFDGKDWTECIYEVPRKTTGKIERLEMQEIHHGGEDLVLRTEIKPATPYDMHLKINEIIDWINDNHKDSK